jgi:hypothetical protein
VFLFLFENTMTMAINSSRFFHRSSSMKRRNTRNGKSPVRTRNTRRRNRVGSNRKSRRGGQSTGLADVTSTLKVGDLHPSLVAVVRHYLSSTWHPSGFLFVLPFRWDLHRMHTNLRFFFFVLMNAMTIALPFLVPQVRKEFPANGNGNICKRWGGNMTRATSCTIICICAPMCTKEKGKWGTTCFPIWMQVSFGFLTCTFLVVLLMVLLMVLFEVFFDLVFFKLGHFQWCCGWTW